jgi:hypothetical protein
MPLGSEHYNLKVVIVHLVHLSDSAGWSYTFRTRHQWLESGQ